MLFFSKWDVVGKELTKTRIHQQQQINKKKHYFTTASKDLCLPQRSCNISVKINLNFITKKSIQILNDNWNAGELIT